MMTIAQNRGYLQEVLYSCFAGANTDHVKRHLQDMWNGFFGLFAESKFLSLTVL